MNANYKSKGNKNLWQIFSAVCLSVFLSVAAVSAQTPLRANGKIAFTSDRDGNREIYVMNPDGSNQTRITNNSISDDHPTWSPDGRKIAFISQRQTGGFAIFQMNADGNGKTEITPVNYQPSPSYASGWTISWSPDGRQIVFVDVLGNVASVFIVNADGSNRRFLTNGYNPAWSPDGSKILFIRGAFPWKLHTIKPDGTDFRTLPPLPNFYNWYYDATWSPTGSEIAITAFDGANEVIFISNADGTNPREFHYECAQFSLGCSRLAAPSWSPDGRAIAFLVWGPQSGIEIYVKDIAGGASRRLTNTSGNNSDPSWQPLPRNAVADFDGDGRSDISVFRPSNGTWYLNRSTQGFSATPFGLTTDKITPADYDGDGKTDLAVFRDGVWHILNSANNSFSTVSFGLPNDVPVAEDFDGDSRADTAVFRQGFWYILNSANNSARAEQFGAATDKPIVGDFDGDGKNDLAVYRDGNWFVQRSQQGFFAAQFGLATDKTVAADYDADGKTDLAVYRSGTWYLQRSTQGFATVQFGSAADVPAPADYDGDGRTDVAVFRNGTWYLLRSQQGFAAVEFGAANDLPVPSAYIP